MEPLRLRNHQYATLFKNVVLSHYPLDAIAEAEALYNGYSTHPDHEEIKLHCESLISAIYFFNKLHESSLGIDLKILKALPRHHPMYYAVINRATETSSRSGRHDEVLPFVLSYLDDPAEEFYKILFLLRWYVIHYSDNDNGILKSYEHTLASIASAMGTFLDETKTFAERVEFLVSEFHRADKDLHALKIAYINEPKERFSELLDNYLDKENLLFFKDEAIRDFRT